MVVEVLESQATEEMTGHRMTDLKLRILLFNSSMS
jgi:hypothetical protein